MTAWVIQGSFVGTQPKLAASIQPRMAAPPPTRIKIAVRPPGPPAPAFARQAGAVQRHGGGGAFAIDSGALGLASGGGKPLPDAVRSQMEAALGADFSNVRVHVGPQAERIGAIAFTVGSDIYFAPGRYQPDTVQGQQLLGHELAHVVQQRAGRVRNPLGSGLAVVEDHALEAEADRLGRHAAAPISAPRAAQRSARLYRVEERPGNPQVQQISQAYFPATGAMRANLIVPSPLIYRGTQGPPPTRTTSAGTRNKTQALLQASQRWPRAASGTVQRAYFARRALGGVLGGGDLTENPLNKGVFHEHLFFEDGQEPKDIGFFADGLHADLPSNRRLYTKLGGAFGGVFDDGIMRQAVEENMNPGNYALLGNNCQAWITRVLASYNRIAERYGDTPKNKTHTPQWVEMS